MTAGILAGLVFGLGYLLLASGWLPAPVPLSRALADLHRPPASPGGDGGEANGGVLARRLGKHLAATPVGRRITDRPAADLAITQTSPASYLAAHVGLGLAALLWAPLAAAVAAAGGVPVDPFLPLWVSLALLPVGLAYPSIRLRSAAADRRRSFRHALSSFLDIVSISLAGGRGVETALYAAAETGHGLAFAEIRQALLHARLAGETPWAGLAALGRRLDIPELGELAASAALAGNEGARVRASLAAKARTLRLKGLAEIEASAQSASERMSVPIVALMLGFVVFLVYPSLDAVLNGL